MVETLSANKAGTLRLDRGGEYMSLEFNAYLAERGIKHQCTAPYTRIHHNKMVWLRGKTRLSWRWQDVWLRVRLYHMVMA